ncbi:MAG: RAMP superfamily CRISPR-associated protein, partial [Oscillospiraceae bacterium]|nr:RAMP superfamily CRISPR-associated protein [Oscillospiraceae bacterium]
MAKKNKKNTRTTVTIDDFTTSFDPAYRSITSTKNNAPFINPYIFLPIPEVKPERGKVIKGPLSGVIKCTLEIKTPTFIPNTSKAFITDVRYRNKPVEHLSYEFYSYEDLSSVAKHPSKPPVNPIIPGSELRGMIRNVYEQLTNSCFLVVDENNLPYKRTPQPKIPAILRYEDDDWYLYKNPSFLNIPIDNVESNVPCTVKLEGEGLCRKAIADENGTHVLHITGELENKVTGKKIKQSHVVFDPTSGNDKVKLDKDSDILERFENVIRSYCDEKVNLEEFIYRYKAYQKRYEAKKTLFVYMDETGTYLSPSQLTKEYFVSKIPNILHTQNKHDKCTDFEHVCPACQLFGMIGDEGAVRGRVRFTDA